MLESKNILLVNNNVLSAFQTAVTLRGIGEHINVTVVDEVDETLVCEPWLCGYDLVLLDLHRTEVSSYSFLASVQAQLIDVNIGVFSTNPMPNEMERVIDLGVNGYISNVSEPDEIKRAVSKLLAGKHHLPLH